MFLSGLGVKCGNVIFNGVRLNLIWYPPSVIIKGVVNIHFPLSSHQNCHLILTIIDKLQSFLIVKLVEMENKYEKDSAMVQHTITFVTDHQNRRELVTKVISDI